MIDDRPDIIVDAAPRKIIFKKILFYIFPHNLIRPTMSY